MLALVVAVAMSAGGSSVFIHTKDGKLHAGTILSKTATGYLFFDEDIGETTVIAFPNIRDIREAVEPPDNLDLAPVPKPLPPAQPRVDHTARIAELTVELHHLQIELHDASLTGPIVKLLLGTAGAAAGFIELSLWSAHSPALTSDPLVSSGSICLAAGVTFLIWGGIQLGMRLATRGRLPTEIKLREQEIRSLEAH